MKIIAYYLPQFHEIPENNEWWGDGFTEWTNVKKSEPLYEGHYQPHVPLDGNYYDLSNDDVLEWQINLAKKHGIYGFCFYHYWFNGRLLLENPTERYLSNPSLEFPYCFCWANHSWTRNWSARSNEILIKQEYGGYDKWKSHFDYLLPFFRDKRYIKKNGKPLFLVFRAEYVPKDMFDCWKTLSVEAGLPGLDIAFCKAGHEMFGFDKAADYVVDFQPHYAISKNRSVLQSYIFKIGQYVFNKYGIGLKYRDKNNSSVPRLVDYNAIWNNILSSKPTSESNIPCVYMGWDNTPRYGKNGSVHINNTPEKFENFLKKQILRARDEYKKDILFMFAWNEWAEGAYLEPDEKYGYGYLEAVRNALIETDEFPNGA